MKLSRLIKLFRKLLVRGAKHEFKYATSLDGCVDNVAVDMIKALYAAYHGLDDVDSITESDLITDWACNTFELIQRGLAE